MDNEGRPQLSLMSPSDVPVYIVPGLVVLAPTYGTPWFRCLLTDASGFLVLALLAYVVGLVNRWMVVVWLNWLWGTRWSNRWRKWANPIRRAKLDECESYREILAKRSRLTLSMYGLSHDDGQAVAYLAERALAEADPGGYQRIRAMGTLEVALTCLATALLVAEIELVALRWWFVGVRGIGSTWWLAGLGLLAFFALWDRAERIREYMRYCGRIYEFAALKTYKE